MKTTIDDAARIFTLINTFKVHPGKASAVVQSLARFTEETARHLEGFVGTSVHTSSDGNTVVNYVQWRSAGHLVAMLALPSAKAHMDEVSLHCESINPVSYIVSYVSSVEI